MIEVLASVISSPHFLYLIQHEAPKSEALLTGSELATRLAMFLWSSLPDEELRSLGAEGKLKDEEILAQQVDRLLADPRSLRFSEHFVSQWLGLELLDFLRVDRKAYPHFDARLQESMREEPIAFFRELLKNDLSVLDLVHADYVVVDERLARHYGIEGVFGDQFRQVSLEPHHQRGGVMTQAGILAMNSDGKDSHPLKRGIWMLERLLNDPPPPPPAAVPEIDLADPEIAKMTLKERMEDHRNQPACNSCHAKIDPWGLAFEHFDALGEWRAEVQGKPVDATSFLLGSLELEGVEGVKRFLLENRQDQLVRALVHKMTAYALGRPLSFGDRASVDEISGRLRRQGDGLATLVRLIVTSEIFRSNG